ncbi:transcription/translation regulatory transformer protein RfaH [Oceanospirillaceae bacterium]|nr:transcription/translation regulatory transformer protein RfaH [Oceanospirillaceae bacterium]MDC1350551.1 transcription/translation regulatory transformer protein RfaH [Oceanospirillaceae bacterium]
MSMSNWLLLQVKPKQEIRALENLKRQGGGCYCPKILIEKLIRGKRVEVEEALFPGYLFINIQPETNGLTYTNIRSSRGVSKIVSFGSEPIKVPEALILQIKQREKADSMGSMARDLPQLGDNINITEGPFRGLKAVFSHTDGLQRSIVLINLLNQETPTSIANTQIKKLS